MDTAPDRPAKQPLARKLMIDLSVMTVIGVFMAVIGPLGSINDPFATRLMVWLGLAYAGYFIYSPVGWFVEKLHRAYDLPRAPLWVAGTLVATVPMTAVVWSLGQINTPGFRLPSADVALTQYGYVLAIGGAVTLLFNVVSFGETDRAAATPAQSANSPPSPSAPESPTLPHPRLIERLPASLGSDVIALEMEDHYVRVHTALGSEMVLMRLRDAIAELDGVEGRQVHRSWWVARGAVEDVQREGRNVRLKLARDIEAPVSRAQVSELKDAGWI